MDPCGTLTDIQYLQHMIPHHQVALDMSKELLKTSKWPELLSMARNIIWVQDMEIKIMNAMVNHETVERVSSLSRQEKEYIVTWGDLTYPNHVGISDIPCDPSFFGGGHGSYGSHGSHGSAGVSDEAYISHMIPHHQVAIDMSKRLLKNTTNDSMIHLAYTIIRNQQAEIVKLFALGSSKMRFQSSLCV